MNYRIKNLGVRAIKGYKQSPELVEKRRQSLLNLHRKLPALCANCGKELVRANERIKKGNCYCNGKCQMDYEYKNGIRDPHKTTLEAHNATRRLVKEGNHPFQRSDNPIKANRVLGHKNYGKTWLEEKMGWALTQLGIKFEIQFPVKYGLDILGRVRYYFPDFALPNNHILVECDGKQWHKSKSRDNLRQSRLEELGWQILRFPEDEIKNNVMDCAYKIQSFLPVV